MHELVLWSPSHCYLYDPAEPERKKERKKGGGKDDVNYDSCIYQNAHFSG